MKALLALVLVGLLSGCSVVGRDLDKTIFLAEKYGKPEIAMCAKFLRTVLDKDAELVKEDTDGLISLAMKYYLLGDSDPQAEAQFKAQCGNVAAGLILEGRKALRD